MKYNLITCALIAGITALYACNDKSSFTIKGQLSHADQIKKAYLWRADSTNLTLVDSSTLDGGQFNFKHTAPYANLYRIKLGQPKVNPEQATGGDESSFEIIAKNGDKITLKSDLADPTHTYQITGSDESEKLRDFNKISNIWSDKMEKLSAEITPKVNQIQSTYKDKAKQDKLTDSLMNVYNPQVQQIRIGYSNDILKFINANKTSLAAFYASTSLDALRYESELVAYADAIKGKFNDNPGVQKFIKAMAYAEPLSVGHQAPDFTTNGLNGKAVKLSDYKGKYVMLDFWASWCGPCREENPNVVKAYKAFHNKGLNILGVSLDVDKSEWQRAINSDKLAWNHASDLRRFDGPTETAYHIEQIPSNFIIDPSGKIIAKNLQGIELEDFLKRTFNKAQ